MRWPLARVLLLCAGLGVASCTVDPDSLPKTYLLLAQQAVGARDAPTAVVALDHAAALWVNGNYGAPFIEYDPTALREIWYTRIAVLMGRWGDAEYYVRTALAQPSVVIPGY